MHSIWIVAKKLTPEKIVHEIMWGETTANLDHACCFKWCKNCSEIKKYIDDILFAETTAKL